jgi:hypothetical protein
MYARRLNELLLKILHTSQGLLIFICCTNKSVVKHKIDDTNTKQISKSNGVPQHAMEALWGREDIALTHS